MLADYYGHYTASLRQALLTLTYPLEKVAITPKKFFQWLEEDSQNLQTLQQDNTKLKTENLLLKARILELEHYRQEAKRLEKLLGTSAGLQSHPIQIANVIYYSQLPLSQFLVIDKGSLEGVPPQMPVIDAYGILGQTIAVTPVSSKVLLITDPDHQMPVRLRRTAQRGILSGIGHDKVRLDFIPKESSIKAGDLIESSGLGGIFPAGYPVAEVESVHSTPESPYLDIIAKPTAQISLSYKVLVLKRGKQNAQKPFPIENGASNASR